MYIGPMPFRITESLRWAVVEKWMLGLPRNTIAVECGLSNGAVSSIVDDWRRSVGLELAVLIRDIGVTLRKLGMSPAQCATGLRVSKLIEKMGLEDSSIESFLSEVYTRCQDLGVSPNHIARYMTQFVSLLDSRAINQQEAVSIQLIDNIFEGRKQRKLELEEQISSLESKRHYLQLETSRFENALHESLQEKKRVELDLKWKMDLRTELERNGLDVDDPLMLVKATRFLKDSGVTLNEILATFLNFKGMANAVQGQAYQLENLRKEFSDLEEMKRIEDEQLAERKLKNRELDELKSMGFGLWELKTLRNMINELGAQNELEVKNGEAVKRYFSDIENHYADYLKLRSKVKQLRDNEELIRLILVAMGGLGPSISSYLGRKPTANDIREVIRVIEGYPKTTVLVDNSVAEGNQERSSQSPVQVDSASSNQIDEQSNGIKSARSMPSETVSNPTDQELVAHETNLKNKRDTRLLPPRPPMIPKPKRHLRNYTRARTENEKEVGVANDFRKPTLGKNVVLHSQAKPRTAHTNTPLFSESFLKTNTHKQKLENNTQTNPIEKSQKDLFDISSVIENANKPLLEKILGKKEGEAY